MGWEHWGKSLWDVWNAASTLPHSPAAAAADILQPALFFPLVSVLYTAQKLLFFTLGYK